MAEQPQKSDNSRVNTTMCMKQIFLRKALRRTTKKNMNWERIMLRVHVSLQLAVCTSLEKKNSPDKPESVSRNQKPNARFSNNPSVIRHMSDTLLKRDNKSSSTESRHTVVKNRCQTVGAMSAPCPYWGSLRSGTCVLLVSNPQPPHRSGTGVPTRVMTHPGRMVSHQSACLLLL